MKNLKMKNMKPSWILATVLTATLNACALGTSGGIATSEIEGVFELVVTGATAKCEATFRHGEGLGGTYLQLTDGDRIICKDGDTEIEMTENKNLFNQVTYRSRAITLKPNQNLQLNFIRGDKETLVATLPSIPQDFQITAPAPGLKAIKGQALRYSWTPSMNGEKDVTLQITTPNGTSNHYSSTYSPTSGSFSADRTLPVDANGERISGPLNATLSIKVSQSGFHPAPMKGSTSTSRTQSVSFQMVD